MTAGKFNRPLGGNDIRRFGAGNRPPEIGGPTTIQALEISRLAVDFRAYRLTTSMPMPTIRPVAGSMLSIGVEPAFDRHNTELRQLAGLDYRRLAMMAETCDGQTILPRGN